MKLKLTLSTSEITSLARLLTYYVRTKSQDMSLRDYPGDFLALSVLYDVQEMVRKKASNERYLGGTPPPMRKLTLTRNQALALICYTADVTTGEADGPGMMALTVQADSFEGNLLQRLHGTIHQAYLV